MTDRQRSAREKVSEGIRQGIGVLSAFKDALEETINEAKERGDLSPERAKQVMSEALHRAQEAAGDAKERLDFATSKEFDELQRTVEGLSARVTLLERELRGGSSGADAGPTPDEPAGGTSPDA